MKKFKFILLLGCMFAFLSCATTLSVNVQRPAEIDLQGAKSIAIEPISTSNYLTRTEIVYARDIITYLEYNMERGLAASRYYTIIGTNDRRTPADVYLECEIVNLNVSDAKKTERTKNPNYTGVQSGNSYQTEYITEIYYRRNVEFKFVYQYVDGYTNRVIERREISKSTQSEKALEIKDLPDPYDMISGYLSSIVSQISREVVPYTVNKSLTLLEVKNNEDMKYADKLAERGYLNEAYNKYIEIFNATGFFEAYYNAAIVLEAQGKYSEARDMMKSLYLQTLDSRADRALADIENEMQYQYLLQQQQNKRK